MPMDGVPTIDLNASPLSTRLPLTPLTRNTFTHDRMPSLSPQGSRAISAWLEAEVAKKTHPAMFAAVATADKVLYFNAKGDRVFGQPEKGLVDEDTGESCDCLPLWS